MLDLLNVTVKVIDPSLSFADLSAIEIDGGPFAGAGSLSATATVAALVDTVYPCPALSVAVTEPFGSSVESSVVATVNVALPVVGMVTVRAPGVTPKLPLCDTATVTVNGSCGVGLALIVKVASPPSVTPAPAVILISGTSLSVTATVAEAAVGDTV